MRYNVTVKTGIPCEQCKKRCFRKKAMMLLHQNLQKATSESIINSAKGALSGVSLSVTIEACGEQE